MSSVGANAQGQGWALGYLVIGQGLGWLAGAVTFIGGWIYCLATYGFLLGGSLGWIPAGIAASIVGALVAFLWGPIAIAAVWWGLSVWGHKPAVATAEVPSAAMVTADAQAVSAVPSPSPPPIEPPSPPTMATATQALADFQRVYWSGGMAGAVTYTMECYNKLKLSPSLAQWHLCASIDQLGGMQSADSASRGGAATEYFDPYKVVNRQNSTSVDSTSADRVAALKAMLSQAMENQRAATVTAAQLVQQATQSATVAASSGSQFLRQVEDAPTVTRPTFDCNRVVSANLKLICATPALAAADQELATVYRAALSAAASPTTLKESQRDWIRRRNAAPANADGLASMFAERTAQLKALAGRPSG
jgi:uncharacterized protein YecT (DUF1311 family)